MCYKKAHSIIRRIIFIFFQLAGLYMIKELMNWLPPLSNVYKSNSRIRLILVGAFEDEVDPVSDDNERDFKNTSRDNHGGWSDEVEYFMHLSFALVHPSHREGFPNVLLQAGAMDCPVICSAIEGNIDIVENEKTGLIFEVKDETAFTGKNGRCPWQIRIW